MNLIQQANAVKSLSDQQLQGELVRPTGSVPSWIALSELQRRKDMRASYSAMQQQPETSMAEEFAKGLGGAEVGQYGDAVRGGMPSSPTGDQPNLMNAPPPQAMPSPPQGITSNQQPQGFADGGAVMANQAQQTKGADQAPTWMDYLTGQKKDALGLGMLSGPMVPGISAIAEGRPLGQVLTSFSPGLSALQNMGVKLADGGKVDPADDVPESWLYPSRQRFLKSVGRPDIQRSSDPNWPNPRLPMDEAPPGSVPDYVAPPRAGLGVAAKPYPAPMPGQPPGIGPEDFVPGVGKSLGQTWASQLQGRPTGPRSGGGLQDWDPNIAPPQTMAAGVDNTGQNDPDDVSVVGGPERQKNYGDFPDATNSGIDPSLAKAGIGTGQRGPAGVGAGPSAGGAGGSGSAGSGRGVGGSLNIGGEGLAQYIDEVRALQAPDRFGEIEARTKQDRDKIASGMEGERGLALLTAGLGIMGGTSPWAGVNIGQGAQAGIKQWNEASKEMRLAERDLRNAENQITIARANRDEKQLETGMKLYATAEERKQRAADRANASGIAASNKATSLQIAQMDQESKDKDRVEHREQSRINEAGVMATRYTTAADALDMKVATLSANPLAATDPTAQGEIARLKSQAEAIRGQAQQAASMHQSLVIDREVRSGRVAKPTDEKEYSKLASGTRYVAPDGTLRVKP